MKEVFEAMMKDEAIIRDVKGNPIKEAVFFALYDFVKKGNNLADLPWFAVTKFARSHREKISAQKVAA